MKINITNMTELEDEKIFSKVIEVLYFSRNDMPQGNSYVELEDGKWLAIKRNKKSINFEAF